MVVKTEKKKVEGYVRAAFDARWTSQLGQARTIDLCVKYAARQLSDAVLDVVGMEQLDERCANQWAWWVGERVGNEMRGRLTTRRQPASSSDCPQALNPGSSSAVSADSRSVDNRPIDQPSASSRADSNARTGMAVSADSPPAKSCPAEKPGASAEVAPAASDCIVANAPTNSRPAEQCTNQQSTAANAPSGSAVSADSAPTNNRPAETPSVSIEVASAASECAQAATNPQGGTAVWADSSPADQRSASTQVDVAASDSISAAKKPESGAANDSQRAASAVTEVQSPRREGEMRSVSLSEGHVSLSPRRSPPREDLKPISGSLFQIFVDSRRLACFHNGQPSAPRCCATWSFACGKANART